VYVELPVADSEVAAGDSFGAVESVKSASDILSPITGVVVEANALLEDEPAIINKDPLGQGWIAKIRIADSKELEGLMGAEEYEIFTNESE
jgi:glycine cleavage system H protein